MLGVNTPALPASLRRTNQRTVISLLLRLGCASRADLAKAAGISQPTAGKITSELLEMGLLQELDSAQMDGVSRGRVTPPRLGRPGQLLRLDDSHPRFLAVELGVVQTSISALPVAIRLHDEWARQIPTPGSARTLLREFERAAAGLVTDAFWGVLISVPGIVDETKGKVLFSPNLHWLERVDLVRTVQQIWKLPVVLVQEIRTLALGHITAEPGEDFFLVDFGQGVGGAIVLEGQLYPHPMPLSGEVGHTPIPGNSRRCGCGAIGCLETLVSESGLLQSFAAATGGPPEWSCLVQHLEDHGLQPWLGDSLEAAAKVICGALNVLGIHRVVITGTIASLPEAVTAFLAREIRKGAMWARFGSVECTNAPRRRSAGLVAAGLDRLVFPAEENGKSVHPSNRTSPELSTLVFQP